MTGRREELLELPRLLLDEDLTWFELRTPTAYIRVGAVPDELRLGPSAPTKDLTPGSPAPASAVAERPASTSAPGEAVAPVHAAAAPAIGAAREHAVIAPFVDVFYRHPSPDQPPFVEVADPVESGDTVGLIEVMKLFNSITARVDGVVTAIEVEDGTLVEYGQVLLRIAPSGG